MERIQPKLRFPEFKGDWSNHTLEELTVKIGDGLHGTPLYVENSDVYFINGNNLIDGKIVINENSKKVSLETLKKNNKGLDENSILISINGTIGSISRYNDEKIMLGKSVGYFNFKQSKDFYFQILQSKKIQDYFISELTGSTIKNLSLKTLRETTIFQPSFSEQTKIANFLSAVDEKLNLLKEKKALLEEYKKGIMQKIFNQEIRFKDDSGNDFKNWKESILSEVVNLFHGYQFRTSDFTSKGIAVIKISNVIGNNLDLTNLTFIKKERFDDFKSFEIKNDDILMSLTGNIGRIIEVKDKPFSLLQNYRVGKFIPLDENVINKPFLKYLLASDLVFGRFSQLANQSAQANFGKQDMDKINISYPTIEEQNKISNFLSAIDEKIELVSNQIQDTLEYKKGLLQQMFV